MCDYPQVCKCCICIVLVFLLKIINSLRTDIIEIQISLKMT